jgi:hypothetical protein
LPSSIEIETPGKSQKAEPSIRVTLRGTVIDFRAESEKALDSIRRNWEPFSKETYESDRHRQKHSDVSISTLLGILIDVNGDPQNARASICFT